jgi:GT2 family glycosyltransferase
LASILLDSNLTEKLFSIIIPNYNGEKFLEKCIGSILSSSYGTFELIIIDNNSSDNSLKILNNFAKDKRVKIIPLSQNVGFAPANNIGIKHSKGEFLVFINNDTYVDAKWLSELIKIYTLDENVAAIQCMLLNMVSSGVYSMGGSLDYSGHYVPIECVWNNSPIMKTQNRLFWGSGAALSIRRSVLEKTGGFDACLPNDEVDLCWRINLQGGKILLATQAIVYHFGSGSFGNRLSARRIYYSERSMLTSCFRNFDSCSFSVALLYLQAFLVMALAQDVFFRKRSDIVVNRLKAYVAVLSNLSELNSQRKYVQNKIRKVKDTDIKKLMMRPNPLLLFQYSQKTLYRTN